jgi:hypothetical protein
VTTWNPLSADLFEQAPSGAPVTVSVRTLGFALEETLMGYTRRDLEVVLADELQLEWPNGETSPDDGGLQQRELIQAYTEGWGLPRLVGLARRVVAELDVNSDRLPPLRGVRQGRRRRFASQEPHLRRERPQAGTGLAGRGEQTTSRSSANGEHCLVFDRPVPADGLRFTHLISWWRERENIPADVNDREVGHALHARLRASLGDNGAGLKVFDTYATRYRASFDIPALIPQVYLQYARRPSTDGAVRGRGPAGPPADGLPHPVQQPTPSRLTGCVPM